MRKPWSLVAVGTVAITLGLAGQAAATVVAWEGTLTLIMGNLTGDVLPPATSVGVGVATVNGSSGLGHLDTLRLAGGLTTDVIIPLTDPLTATLISVRATGLGIGTGRFDGISGGPPLGPANTMVPRGNVKLCIIYQGCGNFIPIPLATTGGFNGVGVGGEYTINTYSKGAGFKMSLQGAPWTIGVASVRNVTTVTPNGQTITYTATLQGFVHAPASLTSSTALPSGLIQLVTPVRVVTSRLLPPDVYQAAWAEIRLRFVPEPSGLLLLGSGVGGLLLLGRSRMRGR